VHPVTTLRGLSKLTWLELKIFVREPMGLVGSVFVPVVLFIILARALGPEAGFAPDLAPRFGRSLPAFSALTIAMNAAISLVTIIAIYRDSGILKRLRATPLGPIGVLSAHVAVKLVLTIVTLAALALAGGPFYPVGPGVPYFSFGAAVLFATWSIVSIGFVIASLVPTARFAQPFASFILYPMLALSGLFAPLSRLPDPVEGVVRRLPLTAAASLLDGVWRGEGWVAHGSDVVTLVATFVICMAVSSRVFRWE
jgi:ABC-2 type transport system permease protein